MTKAMSVRLRAPDGGFFIETASPETQWIERAMLLSSEDFASWRWHVTPRDKGRRRLQLIISARTVSADGLAAETALPDQVITVRVHTNYRQSGGAAGSVGAPQPLAGGLLAKFGEGAFDACRQRLIRLISRERLRCYARSATMPAMVARSSSTPRPFSADVTMTCGNAAGCLPSFAAVSSVTAASSCGLILSALVSTA